MIILNGYASAAGPRFQHRSRRLQNCFWNLQFTRYCRAVALRLCGAVALWRCGAVAPWRCGAVAPWRCHSATAPQGVTAAINISPAGNYRTAATARLISSRSRSSSSRSSGSGRGSGSSRSRIISRRSHDVVGRPNSPT